MNLSKNFFDLSKDWRLIRITRDGALIKKIKADLIALGWAEVDIMKFVTAVSYYRGISISFNGASFQKGQHYVGSREWYKDLAFVCMPRHEPGFLVKLLG